MDKLSFIIRVPFDWKTPFGYLIVSIIQFLIMFCVGSVCACYVIYLVGTCLVLKSFADHTREDISALNYTQDPIELMQKFSKSIYFHGSSKQLS